MLLVCLELIEEELRKSDQELSDLAGRRQNHHYALLPKVAAKKHNLVRSLYSYCDAS